MTLTARQAALKHGYRSGLEDSIATSLENRGAKFTYESLKIKWVKPQSQHTYTPDFIITTRSGKQIIIESKGRWLRSDRMKMLEVVRQHPELDIRMVFQTPNAKIAKGAKTTYALWCQQKLGILWSRRDVPLDWIME